MYYKLVDKKPVECDVVDIVWDSDDRVVALDEIGDARISTVFLNIDHRMIDDGPPILFETMVFGGLFGDCVQRYSTWEEAETGHESVVGLIECAMDQQTEVKEVKKEISRIGFGESNRSLDI